MASLSTSLARAVVVTRVDTGAATTAAARAAVPLVVFVAAPYGSIQERFISNPNAAGSFWVTFLDGVVPAANAEGCFEIAPGGSWSGSVANEVRCLPTAANMAIMAGER